MSFNYYNKALKSINSLSFYNENEELLNIPINCNNNNIIIQNSNEISILYYSFILDIMIVIIRLYYVIIKK